MLEAERFAMALQLRSPDDVKRLFSALSGLEASNEDLTLADVDSLALQGSSALSEVDSSSVALSLLVAMATGWVAIRGYERNKSVSWGLAWAGFGYLWPLPAIAASYARDFART